MKSKFENIEELLDCNISGFHQYVLSEPIHLDFASKNLCDMLGVAQSELLSDGEDLYARWVHDSDKDKYFNFIHKLSCGEQTLTLHYRLVRRDCSILYVSDTISTKRRDDGTLIGISVLTDISSLKEENENLQFLNDTTPCGFLKYTCEKQPKVTYINDRMLKMLRFPESKEGEINYHELYKENIYLMIPMEERRKFALYLNRVYTQSSPIAGELTILRCDGTKGYFFGWVTKCVNEQGEEEFQSVCMDVSERYHRKKTSELNRYIEALTDVYDIIFEYDLLNATVKCLYGQKSSFFRKIENIPMQMRGATEEWINNTVYEDDKARFLEFFNAYFDRKFESLNQQPQQIQYRALSSDGKMKMYAGVFLKFDNSISLFCCRNLVDADESALLKSENESLKNLNEMVMHFTDGMGAFEIVGDFITPLYASDNVFHFFGYTKNEWLLMMSKKTPLKEFVARSSVTDEILANLFSHGEAEFTYFDIKTKTNRRIKTICSQKSQDNSSPLYVMMYRIDDAKHRNADEKKEAISIRTFGYFDVFIGDRPIAFRSQKAKELFALLVDRRGGYISSEEAISFLWPDEPSNTVTLARYRKVALRLKNILEEYEVSDVVESVDGKRRIVVEKVQCDLYDYLSGKEEFAQLFKGSYLSNYAWGETTLGELSSEKVF